MPETAASNFPNWTMVTSVSDTWLSAGWMTNMMVQYSLCQQRLREAFFQFSTLASFLSIGQNASGVVSQLYHSAIGGVVPDAHHSMLHGSKHRVGATYALPMATAGGMGFASVGTLNKTNSLHGSSTRNNFLASRFTGSGTSASQKFNLGWNPIKVDLFEAGSVGSAWRYMKGNQNVMIERMGQANSVIAHEVYRNSTLISQYGTGFVVRGSCNRSGVLYYFWTHDRVQRQA